MAHDTSSFSASLACTSGRPFSVTAPSAIPSPSTGMSTASSRASMSALRLSIAAVRSRDSASASLASVMSSALRSRRATEALTDSALATSVCIAAVSVSGSTAGRAASFGTQSLRPPPGIQTAARFVLRCSACNGDAAFPDFLGNLFL